MWVLFLIGLVFIFLGVGIHQLKWYFLISGYNTMSEEKKARVDVDKLGAFIGKYLYIMGAVLILFGILLRLGVESLTLPLIIFFAVSTVFVLIKAQTFDGNVYDENRQLRKGQGKQLVLIISIITIALIFVIVLLVYSSQATKVTFNQESLTIQGMYGETIPWTDIHDVQLVNELPTIERRTNGSSFNSHLKGHFRTTEHGAVLLFLTTDVPQFIYLETDDHIIYLNTPTTEETNILFKNIHQTWLAELDTTLAN